jgi:hypothetical protein
MIRGVVSEAAVITCRYHGGKLELFLQHVKTPFVRVDGQPGERPALADRVIFGLKRDVKRTSRLMPHRLHLEFASVVLLAHRASTLETSALAMLRGGHDKDQVVDPGCDVDRVQQPSEEASHGANKAAERAPGELAGGESENETVNQDSAQVLIV